MFFRRFCIFVSIVTQMKRKNNFIEVLSESERDYKKIFQPHDLQSILTSVTPATFTHKTMHKNTIWYKTLLNAEKTCLKEDKTKKIHYKFDDKREMVEEYNTETQVLLRRAWNVKSKLGGEGKWEVEIGDLIPDVTQNVDNTLIVESKDQPVVTRRNTRINLEWRIRNLPYPIETYSVSANNEDRCIIVRTTNKKYYKRLAVPELDRLGLRIEQANIQFSHAFNTLIIMYKKPQEMLNMDKDWYEELTKVKPVKDVPNECKAQ